jgi:hypothetical protein
MLVAMLVLEPMRLHTFLRRRGLANVFIRYCSLNNQAVEALGSKRWLSHMPYISQGSKRSFALLDWSGERDELKIPYLWPVQQVGELINLHLRHAVHWGPNYRQLVV